MREDPDRGEEGEVHPFPFWDQGKGSKERRGNTPPPPRRSSPPSEITGKEKKPFPSFLPFQEARPPNLRPERNISHFFFFFPLFLSADVNSSPPLSPDRQRVVTKNTLTLFPPPFLSVTVNQFSFLRRHRWNHRGGDQCSLFPSLS